MEGQNPNSTYMPEVKNNFYAPMEPSKDLIICPHCQIGISNPAVKYAGGKETSSPRLWCKICQRKFGVKHKSVNWQIYFGRLYALYFTKSHELNSIRARYNDFMLPGAIRLFDSNLRAKKKTSASPQQAIEKAFPLTMRTLIDKAVKRLRKRDIDNWSIIINKYDSDKCYDLDFKLLKAENKGIVFLSKRGEENPLVHCAHCQSTHIAMNGFSNVGRRRFKCVSCDRSFVLRGRSLFTFGYVKDQMLKLYLQSFKFKTENLPMLEKICSELATLFMSENNMRRITKKLQTEFTVSELFRVSMIELFVKKHSGDYEIVRSKPSEVFERMTMPSSTLLLPRPEEYVGVDVSEVLYRSRI